MAFVRKFDTTKCDVKLLRWINEYEYEHKTKMLVFLSMIVTHAVMAVRILIKFWLNIVLWNSTKATFNPGARYNPQTKASY